MRHVVNQHSPLRYPGGKGKLSSFVASIVMQNGISDGMYVEPYAGGAAVAWDLLLSGLVKRVAINDLNKAIFIFWKCVLDRTDEINNLIRCTPVNMEVRAKLKRVLLHPKDHDELEIAFALFFLNRTNRSGILNAGVIGGKDQTGPWKIDARYNKEDLISRIESIAKFRNRIKITNMDAVEFLNQHSGSWKEKTLVYLDPPYYEKGRDLYYDFYRAEDHANVATAVHKLQNVKWIVSYDDVPPILDLYNLDQGLRYQIGYSARNRTVGTEAMFFSSGLKIPAVSGSMIEVRRWPQPDLQSVGALDGRQS